MGFQKYASTEKILDVKVSSTRLDYSPEEGEMLKKFAATKSETDTDGGYVYVRTRAISSRVNKNNDGWPSEELAKAYRTFVGRPIFVDHNNSDPRRARGVIVDAKLHVEDEKTSALDPYYSSAPDNHRPPTWIELLMEVDARTFPKLAEALKNGEVDATSMGANIDRSTCSVCGNEATVPSEYCSHIKQKGATFEITADNGEKLRKKAYEDCYGVNFFEDSFVFDPADETALNIGIEDKHQPLAKIADYQVPDEVGAGDDRVPFNEQDITCPMCNQNAEDHGTHISCPYCGYKALKGDHHLEHSASADYSHLISKVAVDGNDSERELNFEPQSDKVTAPQKVDTLRDDINCPNCDADILQADPDGILRCPTCGYEQPPEGLDNPDLGKAQDLDKQEQLDGNNEDEGGNDVVRATDEDAADDTENFIKPLAPKDSATNSDVPTGVISEMNWKVRIATDSAAMANAALTKTAASVQTQIEFSGGIHFGTHAAFKAAGITANVTYPGAPGPLPIPGNAMQHFMFQMQAVKAQGLENPGQLTVTVDAPDEQLDEALRLIHNGGNLQAASSTKQPTNKKVVLPGTQVRSDEPKDVRVVADQLAPVTSDRRVIKREETPDGHRTEQIVEETGDLLGDSTPKDEKKDEEKNEGEEKKDTNEPRSQKEREDDGKPDFLKQKNEDNNKQPVAASVEDPQKKLLAALAVAEEAVEMGVIDSKRKMAFVGQLENESFDKIEARRQMLNLVKSAGLTQKRVASTRTARALPRLNAGGLHSSNGAGNLEDIPFEAVFLS